MREGEDRTETRRRETGAGRGQGQEGSGVLGIQDCEHTQRACEGKPHPPTRRRAIPHRHQASSRSPASSNARRDRLSSLSLSRDRCLEVVPSQMHWYEQSNVRTSV